MKRSPPCDEFGVVEAKEEESVFDSETEEYGDINGFVFLLLCMLGEAIGGGEVKQEGDAPV